MTFANLIKIVGYDDLYLTETLAAVPRNQAYIGKRAKCEDLACRRFGRNWPNCVEIFEATEREWFLFLNRRGNKVKTPDRLRALRRNAKRPRYCRRKPRIWKRRGPKPVYKQWWHKDGLAVRAKTVGLANRYVRRFDARIKRGELRRSWNTKKPSVTLPDVDGVFLFSEGQWKQIVK